MKTIVLLPLLLLAGLLTGQDTKGARPANQPTNQPVHQTRAVVVGISDYQHNDIPDLNFAAADARAFADWLRSPAGGSVPEDHVILLTDKNATLGNFAMALDGLVDDCKEGDQAIIYFSGHGDVERKMITQPGYLLCRDAPAICYMGGGAFNLRDLQLVVSTLSLQNKARVVVITDACHAGKLAGNTIGGVQITGKSLAELFANEVKIMSCQPNELSLEGEQWGGGHGVFSYHLVRGMTGLADRNGDGEVTLFEIGRYLEDVVPADVAPMSQMPQIAGEKQTVVSRVDASSLAVLQKEKKDNILIAAGAKGLEDDVLAKADSSGRQQYFSFKAALAAGNLLEPADACANFFHARLVANETFRPLAGLMTRNLAAALIDEVQQALNALLDDDPYAYNKWYYETSRFTQYPEYLHRAMDLLGENHYLRNSLQSKKLYFEALNLKKSITNSNLPVAATDSLRAQVKEKLLEAIRHEDKAAYLYHAIGSLYVWKNQTDSVIRYCLKASEYSPLWLLPYLDVSYDYQLSLSDFFKSEEWLDKALAFDTNSYVLLERLAWLRQWQNRTSESLEISRKLIAMKPDLFNAYGTAGATSLMRKEFAPAEKYFHKMAGLSTGYNNDYYQYWANLLIRTGRLEEGIALADKIIGDGNTEFDFKGGVAHFTMLACLNAGKNWLVEKYASEILKWSSPPYYKSNAFCGMAWSKFQEGKIPEARQWIEKARQIQPDNPIVIYWQARQEAHLAEMEGKIIGADSLFRQAIYYPPNFPAHEVRLSLLWDAARLDYGQFLLRQHRYPEARRQFQTLLDIEPLGYHGYYGMALLAAAEGSRQEALGFLERSCELYLPSAQPILEEPLFNKLRETKRFRELMAKHFPEISKQ